MLLRRTLLMRRSLPSRERGLKSYALQMNNIIASSLPSRERGLKYHMRT